MSWSPNRCLRITREHPYVEANVSQIYDPEEDPAVLEILVDEMSRTAREMLTWPELAEQALDILARIDATRRIDHLPGVLSNLFCDYPIAAQQAVLEKDTLSERLDATLAELQAILAIPDTGSARH